MFEFILRLICDLIFQFVVCELELIISLMWKNMSSYISCCCLSKSSENLTAETEANNQNSTAKSNLIFIVDKYGNIFYTPKSWAKNHVDRYFVEENIQISE